MRRRTLLLWRTVLQLCRKTHEAATRKCREWTSTQQYEKLMVYHFNIRWSTRNKKGMKAGGRAQSVVSSACDSVCNKWKKQHIIRFFRVQIPCVHNIIFCHYRWNWDRNFTYALQSTIYIFKPSCTHIAATTVLITSLINNPTNLSSQEKATLTTYPAQVQVHQVQLPHQFASARHLPSSGPPSLHPVLRSRSA